MKLDVAYERGRIEVVVRGALSVNSGMHVVRYDDPLEALEEARNLTVAAAECMRYERTQQDAQEERDTDWIDARLHERSGDLYYATRVPRDPPSRFVRIYGRTFELDMPHVTSLRGLASCAYREVEVFSAVEAGTLD